MGHRLTASGRMGFRLNPQSNSPSKAPHRPSTPPPMPRTTVGGRLDDISLKSLDSGTLRLQIHGSQSRQRMPFSCGSIHTGQSRLGRGRDDVSVFESMVLVIESWIRSDQASIVFECAGRSVKPGGCSDQGDYGGFTSTTTSFALSTMPARPRPACGFEPAARSCLCLAFVPIGPALPAVEPRPSWLSPIGLLLVQQPVPP